MTKGILSLFIVVIISFSITGCTKREAVSANRNLNNSNEIANKSTSNQSNPSTKQGSDTENDTIQNLSNSMDTLDKTLNDMDNTKDINDTDSLINNLK